MFGEISWTMWSNLGANSPTLVFSDKTCGAKQGESNGKMH
jgi:hypothetical protein